MSDSGSKGPGGPKNSPVGLKVTGTPGPGPFRIPSEKDRIVKLFENLPRTPVIKSPVIRGAAIGLTKKALPPEPILPLERPQAVAKCEETQNPREVVRALLGYGIGIARRALLFYPSGHALKGIEGIGSSISPESVPSIELDLAKPSVFRNFTYGAACYLGPVPRTDTNDLFVRLTGGERPAGALIVPVLAGDRAANLLYLDNGQAKDIEADMGELLLLTAAAGKAYERIISARRGVRKEGL
ncbi:MAG: hypothetical protein KIT79_04610 [Deltaproteobacteria bacterium]|nr:hypothetical protein [Deltaproteobacteria bacterium]